MLLKSPLMLIKDLLQRKIPTAVAVLKFLALGVDGMTQLLHG